MSSILTWAKHKNSFLLNSPGRQALQLSEINASKTGREVLTRFWIQEQLLVKTLMLSLHFHTFQRVWKHQLRAGCSQSADIYFRALPAVNKLLHPTCKFRAFPITRNKNNQDLNYSGLLERDKHWGERSWNMKFFNNTATWMLFYYRWGRQNNLLLILSNTSQQKNLGDNHFSLPD